MLLFFLESLVWAALIRGNGALIPVGVLMCSSIHPGTHQLSRQDGVAVGELSINAKCFGGNDYGLHKCVRHIEAVDKSLGQ